jgi:phosphatidylglycerophosphatase C
LIARHEIMEGRHVNGQPENPGGVALFDLDGTLLAWDTQVLFCGHVVRREGWRRLLLLPWLLASPLAPVLGAGRMKRLFLAYAWGLQRSRLDELVREFVEDWFPGRCFPELLEEIDRQRQAGRRLILASASPEWWVEEAGRVLGFDLSLGTPVERVDRMPMFPELVNHKGEAKVTRLRCLGIAPEKGPIPESTGYSDSTADLPMLGICERVTVVNPGAKLEKIASENGWTVLRPGTPWKGKAAKAWMFLRAMLGGTL